MFAQMPPVYDIHSKFHESRSAGSKVEVGHTHTELCNLISLFFAHGKEVGKPWTTFLLKLFSFALEKGRKMCHNLIRYCVKQSSHDNIFMRPSFM
jgi:hypothetical protein